MKLTIEPTKEFFMAGDVMVRMWQGKTEDDQDCVVLVTTVAFSGQAAAAAEGLISIPAPDAAAQQRWAQSIQDQFVQNDLPAAERNSLDAACLARGALDQIVIADLTPVQVHLFSVAVGVVDNLLAGLAEV